MTTTEIHAEHVGSLLRPPELLDARTAYAEGRISQEELRELENQAALAALSVQREAGISVLTDGEVRRATWMAGLMESIGGVVSVPVTDSHWYREDGMPPSEETAFEVAAATEKVYQKPSHTSREAEFLLRHADRPFKITMMSSSMSPIMWQAGVSETAYPTPAELVQDVMALQIAEIEGLIDLGVQWIQLDSLSYNMVIDKAFREHMGFGAMDPDFLLDTTVNVDSGVVQAVRRKNPDVTVGMHICRGNNRSAWMAEGSYEVVAERLFGEVGVDRFLLEYDTERAGGFEPLRFVRPGTTVVLGLVSSKKPQLESTDELRRRIDEAAKYVPMENLALSPQCGFASTARGNLLTVDDERRKLELVANTASLVWG